METFAGFVYPRHIYVMPVSTPRTPWRKRELLERKQFYGHCRVKAVLEIRQPHDCPVTNEALGLRWRLVEDLDSTPRCLSQIINADFGVVRAVVLALPSRRGFLPGYIEETGRGVHYSTIYDDEQEAAEQACEILARLYDDEDDDDAVS